MLVLNRVVPVKSCRDFFCSLFFTNANILINVLFMESIYLRCDTVQQFEQFFSLPTLAVRGRIKKLNFKKKTKKKQMYTFPSLEDNLCNRTREWKLSLI